MALQLDRNLARAEVAVDAPAPLAETPDARAELAAQFIPAGARVLDLNCRDMALKRYLPNGCHYDGSDLVARDAATIVCDLNAGEFPTKAAAEADVIVMLGVLETIADVESFFTHLRFCKRDLILSYAATDLTGKCDRAALGWINHFSFFDLAQLFDRYGFRIAGTAPLDGVQMLMRLTPSERLAPADPCSVAVLADYNACSFGDRLGLHMIHSMLPGEADVHHLDFETLEQAREQYDLVVVGVGNAIFQPLLNDRLHDIVGRSKASIGIFGTHFRELLPRPAIERLVERLDSWFARYEDDILMYGRGRSNVEHLGDWLIDQFPLATPDVDEPLQVSEDIGRVRAIDGAIQIIQRHRRVYSTQLHPLLCALTSAEMVAYSEPTSPDAPGIVSGTFRSMLIDVFGRSYPEKDFFLVDRDAVTRYKARVHRNVANLRKRIGATLRNVTVAAA